MTDRIVPYAEENHFMLDCETMSTSPTAAIVQIGAVYMGRMEHLPGTIGNLPSWCLAVTLESSVAYGGTVDEDTTAWWAHPDRLAARKTWDPAYGTPAYPIAAALNYLEMFLRKYAPDKDTRVVWAKGTSFDIPVLTSAMARLGRDVPWHFWADRCARTLSAEYRDVIPLDPPRHGPKHDARADALNQAEHWLRIRSHG
jgi:hypothetical protein